MLKPKPKFKANRVFSVRQDGFFGEYYELETKAYQKKGIVVCSGSDGSFLFTQLAACMFADAGMPVIALGYWNEEGTPKDPAGIPVEYMRRACQWLKEEKGLHPAVWGISLGGEYALLCASLFFEIECVVAAAPVHILTQCGSFVGGLHFAKGSPFTLEGKPLPYIGVTDKEEKTYLRRMKKNFWVKREPDMLFYYDEVLKKPHDSAADIKVENIKGPVLLISGEADVMVPSSWVCKQVMERLEQNSHPYAHRHLNYEKLSHYAAMFRPVSSALFKVERKFPKECDESRRKSWEETLKFLAEEWRV
nr:acyl-CoA thioester hydrolase/BAAT C-terminal domain-containing protein [uncultured Shuttleworthia sp.]